MAQFSRRVLLGALLGSVAGHALANAPLTSIRPVPRNASLAQRPKAPSAEGLVDAAKLTGAVTYVVADAGTGKILEARGGDQMLPPASVTKAVTALYALERLGAGFRYRTRLIATGPVSGGRLRGDLLLVGSGDPTLDTDDLGEMARQLKAAGVRDVTGKFIVHASALPQIREIADDQPVQVGYNPAISGLNLNFNRVHFEWKRQSGSYALTMDARAGRYAPQVSVARMRLAERQLPVYTHSHQGGVDNWTVARSALGSGGSRWLPVRRPELYTAEVFQTLARAQGISLRDAQFSTAQPRGTVLVEHRSANMQTILRGMMKYSTNLTAEVVGLTASGASSLSASARQMNSWAKKRLGLQKSHFVDHSGLGDASRLSAEEMVGALLRARQGGQLNALMKDIPMRDAKGNVVQGHPVKIRAKTGTLNFASALAGYMTARDGRELVFAIFSADVPRRDQLSPNDDLPPGVAGWRNLARRLQLQLIDRWGAAYVSG
jgi:D-alanyl-D-alanine carboxypeptidase/D-alanyl-D-alanine-endopeptidase (penicillin-binding protein 4)